MIHLVRHAGLHERIEIDSAGTGGWHAGELPDPRTRAHAERRGLSLTSRARQFERDDFDRFDYVVAMDRRNRDALVELASRPESARKVRLLRSFDPASTPECEVPDPYYGGADGFEHVLDLCFAACEGLLATIRREHRF